MANSWYFYTGGDILNVGSYQRVATMPTCTGVCFICAVFLIGETSSTPTIPFDSNTTNDILNALASRLPQPTTGPPYTVLLTDCKR